MRIRLVRKLADHLDGIDVSGHTEGDVLELPQAEAELLIAEQWALPCHGLEGGGVSTVSVAHDEAGEADRSERRALEQIRRIRDQTAINRFESHEYRRAEDRIREEMHDARSRTYNERE
jgi:hypothetical protein